MHNTQLAQVFVLIMFATLAMFYLSLNTGKLNYLFLLMLLFQAAGDFNFVKGQEVSYLIALVLYFLVNFMLVLMLSSRIKILGEQIKKANKLSYAAYILTGLFIITILLGYVNIAPIFYGLMMLLLVMSAYLYYDSFMEDKTFWMLFGVISYLVCSLIGSFEIYIISNVYYVSLKVIAYVVSMYCITFAVINEK